MAFCATSLPVATDPSGFRFGPRWPLGRAPTNSLGALAPRRGLISMMIGTASSDLVQPLGVHPNFDRPTRGFMHFLARTSLACHVDSGRHRFSCPFFS